jgi:hypothetical protein
MKKTTMTLMVAAGLILQAVAAEPNSHVSASINIQNGIGPRQNSRQVGSPFLGLKPGASPTIERYGKFSSQPWTRRVGWPQWSSFADDQNYSPNLNLFWVGATPQ